MIQKKTLTLDQTATEQLKRIAHLPGFPREPVAIADYKAALCSLGEPGSIERLMDDVTHQDAMRGDSPRAPTASELWRLAFDRKERQQRSLKNCDLCDGQGVVTVWKLVTYFGRTFKIKNTETLHDVHGQEQANERIKNLMAWLEQNPQPDNQTILTAAKRCACRAAA